MRFLRKRGGEHPPVSTEPAPECEHVTLIPRWDRAEDIGRQDRVSLYRCEACGREFTLAEANRLRATEEARIQRKLAG